MLELRLLGGFEVRIGGAPVRCQPAPGRLLCRLAIDTGRALTRSRLWQELWPDSDTGDALDINLRRLRRDILGSEANRLRTDGTSVLLDLDGAEVDFRRFQTLTDDGDIAALEEAVRLYRGELLQRHLEEGWLLDLRDDLRTRFEDALKTLAEDALKRGRVLVATRHLRRFVESNPNYEWGWVKLIETYTLSGNSAEANATYVAYAEHARQQGQAPTPRARAALATPEDLPVPTPLRSTDQPLALGGALPPDTPYYVARPEDDQMFRTLALPGATVRIKGPRQVGKSSLLARALQRCRDTGMLVLLTDWQNLPPDALESADSFYRAVAYRLARQAGLEHDTGRLFLPDLAPGDNFDHFIETALVPTVDRPIVWAIDEADRLFSCNFRDEVFAKLRAWHNDRALDPDSPWRRFSLVLAHSTEARLFIANLNQSPFNVGLALTLRDFTPEQSESLNLRYGSPFSPAEMERLHTLVGGHPYLTSRALYEARCNGQTLAALEASALRPESPFGEHLERLRFALSLTPSLADAVRTRLANGPPPATEPYLRLLAAGVVVGESPSRMALRCRLYESYLRRTLA